MTYAGLGFRPVKASADTTGMNTGNYTCVFNDTVIAVNVPYFELYHFYLTAPQLSGTETTVQVMLNQGYWDYNLIGQANAWDPSQPMILSPGDVLYFFFNVPTSNTTVPVVYAWFRYDITYTNGVPISSGG
jgi:hypothetical protein